MAEMTLKDYYDSMSDEDRVALREKWLAEAELAYPTFYYKLMNDKFSKIEKKLFFEIYEDMGYEISEEEEKDD